MSVVSVASGLPKQAFLQVNKGSGWSEQLLSYLQKIGQICFQIFDPLSFFKQKKEIDPECKGLIFKKGEQHPSGFLNLSLSQLRLKPNTANVDKIQNESNSAFANAGQPVISPKTLVSTQISQVDNPTVAAILPPDSPRLAAQAFEEDPELDRLLKSAEEICNIERSPVANLNIPGYRVIESPDDDLEK